MKNKNAFYRSIIASMILFFDLGVSAQESFPVCPTAQISELKSTGIPLSVMDLSSVILIAREARIYAESSEYKIQVEQDFIQPKSSVVCLSSSGPEDLAQFNISLSAPTLLGIAGDKGNDFSVWQFNIIVDGKKVGIWNQFNRTLSAAFKLSSLGSLPGQQVQLYQTNHGQFELIIKSNTKSESRAIVVIFDAVSP